MLEAWCRLFGLFHKSSANPIFVCFYRANEKINVYACDCSVEALERAKENLENAGLVMDRFHPFCCDFSATQFPKWLACDSCRNICSEKSPHSYPG